ncbi:MAG: hypothetical protein MZV63_06130 [Marinilabiliales bacterium]|nr:hypothetical protein [Marinilabiliales bacterium]
MVHLADGRGVRGVAARLRGRRLGNRRRRHRRGHRHGRRGRGGCRRGRRRGRRPGCCGGRRCGPGRRGGRRRGRRRGHGDPRRPGDRPHLHRPGPHPGSGDQRRQVVAARGLTSTPRTAAS